MQPKAFCSPVGLEWWHSHQSPVPQRSLKPLSPLTARRDASEVGNISDATAVSKTQI